MSRLLTAALLVVALPACEKKQGSDSTAKERTREEVCRSYADQAIMLAKAIAGGIASGSGLEAADRRQLASELDAELEPERKKLVDECLAYPDDVIDCLRHAGLGDDCDAAIARAQRARIPKLPAGPTPAWSFALADKPDHVILGDGGVVFATIDDRVVAVAAGKQLWSIVLEDADELRIDDDGSLLVLSMAPHLVALDPATGAERWRLVVPGDRYVRVWAPAGRDLLLGTSDARFFRRNA